MNEILGDSEEKQNQHIDKKRVKNAFGKYKLGRSFEWIHQQTSSTNLKLILNSLSYPIQNEKKLRINKYFNFPANRNRFHLGPRFFLKQK